MRAEFPLRFLSRPAKDIAPAGVLQLYVASDTVREPARTVTSHE